MLNKVLRVWDIKTLMKLGFFITDLYSQLNDPHSEQRAVLAKTRTLYRDQVMSKAELKHIKAGQFLSFNSFLSSTDDRQLAFKYLTKTIYDAPCTESDLKQVLFIVNIDLNDKKVIPFVDSFPDILFLDVLCYLPYPDNSCRRLIGCLKNDYKDKKLELKVFDKFERDYKTEKAVW
ncbi:unnamed protein product [Didymodactylos carnosus]|uniref:Uncharacterized protein n=1 Tax=Didymodactylos carnosus TaxID=1234261 RepID=A0A815ZD90_9BILA|nr:unnamed protein product [Didymodactylos carnosus]CAF1638346.1 unnamed protein product [Didymodactylos carnosus]CAF4451868.1 unnamed protein product [Didymodactylos carnosus]CAF4472008.1 unnamed protein product [Didymodactylos carnosus]